MTKKIVLTGGSGFVGRAVATHLTASGYNVLTLSRHNAAHDPHIKAVNYADERQLVSALAGAQAIVHLAGTAHVHLGDAASEIYAESIVRLTAQVWNAACRAGVSQFIYASTLKVYDEPQDHQTIDEQSPCHPTTPYGQAKLRTELFLQEQSSLTQDQQLTILRFPPMYGVGMRGSLRHIFNAARLGIPVPLRTFEGRRHFLFVGNAARIIRAVVERTLPARIYLPHDPEEWTPALLYRTAYEIKHGHPMPQVLLWPLPSIIMKRIRDIPRFQALVANFPLCSKYQDAYRAVPFVSSHDAIRSSFAI